MRPLLKLGACLLAVPLELAALYCAAAFALVLVPANRETVSGTPTVEAYIASNGVHADFVFPTRSPAMDWTGTYSPCATFPPWPTACR